jgi:hypothetical protein
MTSNSRVKIVLSEVFVCVTIDCERVRTELTPHASRMSPSGPANYSEGERSIRGYVNIAKEYEFPTTLFVHPEADIRRYR